MSSFRTLGMSAMGHMFAHIIFCTVGIVQTVHTQKLQSSPLHQYYQVVLASEQISMLNGRLRVEER